MTNVLVIQPGFPFEVPFYVRGLARAGARVVGVGDQAASSLPAVAREALTDYLQVPELWHAPALVAALRGWNIPLKLDRVECLWEPAMELAAEIRREFGLPGLDPEQTRRFRDKHVMRTVLDHAGIRNARHGRARTNEQMLAAADHVGYPLVVKPVDGAGSANTYRVESRDELMRLRPALSGVADVVVEEFIEGREYTFDTICAGGRILFHNILRYTPNMLESRSREWISPQNMVLRDLDRPEYHKAYDLGRRVLQALEFGTGFSHMEWFHTPANEAVFLEIAGRPPGGMTGELINYCCDTDIYQAWGEAVLYGRIGRSIERKYNVAMIFKRAIGQGRIFRVEGVEEMYRRFGRWIMRQDLAPVGAPRRDWKQTLLSDGFVILRHPDLDTATRMSAWVAKNVRLLAG